MNLEIRRHHFGAGFLLSLGILEDGRIRLDVDPVGAQLVRAQKLHDFRRDLCVPVISCNTCGSKCSAMISALSL
jgi:hypothetical protein